MATVSVSSITCAPGNAASVLCSDFTAGPATVSIDSQLVAAVNGIMTTASVVVPATIGVAEDGFTPAVLFTVPDGLMNGTATITDSAANTATFGVAFVSQYAQQSDYVGEGYDASGGDPTVPTGAELDVILRRASAFVDSYIGGPCRLMTWFERHRFRKSRRLYPYHRPVVSIQSLSFVTSNTVRTVFAAPDLYVDPDLNYVEMLAYGFGNYALLGAFETVGYSANVLELTLTAGYTAAQLPDAIREATIMIASSLNDQRRKRFLALGGLKQTQAGTMVSDGLAFAIPADVKRMLAPFIVRTIR